MFDKLKKLFGKPEPIAEVAPPAPPKEKKVKKPRQKKVPEPQLSAKEQATQNDQPYVNILHIQIDPNDVNNGAFELDWNDKFILNLIRAGYKIRDDDTDQIIVDRWFQTVCRNVALEIYEQQQADPENRDQKDLRVIRSRDIGNGRTEVS